MVEIGSYDSRSEAERARSLLTAQRIPCLIVSDVAPGTLAADGARLTRLLVAEADADQAARILRRADGVDE